MLLRATCFDVSFILQLNLFSIFFFAIRKQGAGRLFTPKKLSCIIFFGWVQITALRGDKDYVLKVHVYGFVSTS